MLLLNNFDTDEVSKIHDNSFPMPCLSGLYPIRRMAINEGKLIAAGLVKVTAEGILFADQSLPAIQRAKAAKEIILSMEAAAKDLGLDECHVFVKRHNVQRFLRHLGFKSCIGGDPMIIHF